MFHYLYSPALALIFTATILTSCGPSHGVHRAQSLCCYQTGHLYEAEQTLDVAMCREMPRGNYLHSPNATWMLLDRGTLRFVGEDAEGATSDYRCAIEAMDRFNQISLPEQLCQTLFQDDFGVYAGDYYEQVLARVYLALALLHEGDLHNAEAILRQAEELQQRLRASLGCNALTQHIAFCDNPLAKYLLASMLQARGDVSNASILFNQALDLAPELPDPPNELSHDTATVLIVTHNGNAPYKVTSTVDDSVICAMALEIFLDAQGIPPAMSSFGGIPIPVLAFDPMSRPHPVRVSLNQRSHRPGLAYDVGEAACRELDQRIPLIAARAAARLVARRGVVAAAHEHSPELGLFTDLAMCVANSATCADTRSWGTLPLTLELARYDVTAGQHCLEVDTDYDTECSVQHLNLPAGSLCVINIFHTHPGVCHVCIPQRYLANPGD